jgi:hypothetical protein
MFFIIWGSKWKYEKKPGGMVVNKFCPNCKRQEDMFEVIPKKYFTLYWIPLFSTEQKDPLLECPNCHEKFYI